MPGPDPLPTSPTSSLVEILPRVVREHLLLLGLELVEVVVVSLVLREGAVWAGLAVPRRVAAATLVWHLCGVVLALHSLGLVDKL